MRAAGSRGSRSRVSAPRIAQRSACGGNWARSAASGGNFSKPGREWRPRRSRGWASARGTAGRRCSASHRGQAASRIPGAAPSQAATLARLLAETGARSQLAAGDPVGDEAEAVADIKPLGTAGPQEVLVSDNHGAGGAEPRPKPARRISGRTDCAGRWCRRAPPAAPARRAGRPPPGPAHRRFDGPVPEHRDRMPKTARFTRGASARISAATALPVPPGKRARQAAPPVGGRSKFPGRDGGEIAHINDFGRAIRGGDVSGTGRLDTVIEFVHFASHFCLRRRPYFAMPNVGMSCHRLRRP